MQTTAKTFGMKAAVDAGTYVFRLAWDTSDGSIPVPSDLMGYALPANFNLKEVLT